MFASFDVTIVTPCLVILALNVSVMAFRVVFVCIYVTYIAGALLSC